MLFISLMTYMNSLNNVTYDMTLVLSATQNIEEP